MDKEVIKLYEELTKVAIYDKKTKTYHISKEDYQILGLTHETTRRKIKKICSELGVNLEYPNKTLPDIKGEELFSEYNQIKSLLETTSNIKERTILEERRIKLRNLIIEYNMDLIKLIINRRLNNSIVETINNNYDIEELYQTGYEFLINYIDNQYLEKKQIKYYIHHLLHIIIKKTLESEFGINEYSFEELLNFEKIVNIIRLDEIEDLYGSINPLEENFIKKEQKELLYKILKTLKTKKQQETIILSFGLNNKGMISNKEISSITEYAPETIRKLKERAIKQLSYSSRSKYIKQIMGINISKEESNNISQIKLLDEYKALKNLERFLLKQLDKNLLDKLIENLNFKLKESLLVYLGYIEKSERFNSDGYQHSVELERVLNYIRNKINEIYVIGNKNEEITNYLDYLMYYYLNNSNIKTKSKIKKRLLTKNESL